VFPGDVERVLAEHPSVAEAGVTAPTGGLVALVVAAPGAAPTGDELMAFSRDRLAPHEVPAAVRFVQQLPRNSVGKLVRAELQALAERPDLSR
jgi:acyl-coenzyme A synthetase/AMP-(fatty) acid ligase